MHALFMANSLIIKIYYDIYYDNMTYILIVNNTYAEFM